MHTFFCPICFTQIIWKYDILKGILRLQINSMKKQDDHSEKKNLNLTTCKNYFKMDNITKSKS